MSRAKVFTSILMVLILIALSGASVWAAPGGQEEDQDQISGVVTDIVIEVDEEGTTTVLVTLDDTQTVRLSLETAIKYGLVVVTGEDEQGNPIVEVNEGALQQDVTIDPDDVIKDGEEGLHPVASALAKFFTETLGLDYATVMGYHEDGMGFGVIAKACWMSYALEGDATLLGDILEAKKSHDFSSIELPDGGTAKNWGQFKKAVLTSDKAKKNLGAIMSGRAEQDETDGDDLGAAANQGQGKGKKGKGPGEDGPPGKSKGGKPETPPGQDKKGGGGKGKDK
jgi:hypothetical protein